MQKKIYAALLCMFFIVSSLLSPLSVGASETEESKEPTEMEKNYEIAIESNKIEGWPEGPKVYAKAAFVMDVNTGTVLYEKNADEALYPASITKIMTTLLAIENCELDETVTFSDNAINSLPWECSRIGARVGETFSLEDCLYAMMLSSANEVCIGVAEHIAGSEEAFVDMMNERAEELGCTNTHFVNCNGMPNKKHKISARDMGLIAAEAYKNETFQKVTGSKSHRIGYTNKCGEYRYAIQHHKMLKDTEYYYEYCVGGKTGYTEVALNTLVTYAKKGNQTLVCVSLRTNGSQYYVDTKKLLEYGFNNFKNLKITNKDSIGSSSFSRQFLNLTEDEDTDSTAHLVTVPEGVKKKDLTETTTLEGDTITHSFTYKDIPVGSFSTEVKDSFKELLSASSLPTLSAEEIPELLKSSHAVSEAEEETKEEDESTTTETVSALRSPLTLLESLNTGLTSWQLGLCGVLVIAILIYIVILIRSIVRAVKKHKRKKKKARRKKANENKK